MLPSPIRNLTNAQRVATRYLLATGSLRMASAADLNVFRLVIPVFEHLVAEASTLPPGYKNQPGNWWKSPTSKVGMHHAYRMLMEKGSSWSQFVIDHKVIPPEKAKAIEMAVRVFSRTREPTNVLSWFEDNKARFQLLIDAEKWPDRSEEAGIRIIGPFRVHDTIGSSEADWAKATQIIERAVREMPNAGLSGFPAMAYGDLYMVGQIGRKNWAAWYIPAKDTIYLRPNIRGVTLEESARHLIHELGHRFWARGMSNDKKKAWSSHHTGMTYNKPSGRIPEVGEVLPLLVNNKKVKVQDFEGGQAVLVEADTGAPVGKVLRLKLWEWMADSAQKLKFPSLYAGSDVEEHFCEAVSLKATGKLTGDNLEAYDRIFNV